jgi:hypothetical protein
MCIYDAQMDLPVIGGVGDEIEADLSPQNRNAE